MYYYKVKMRNGKRAFETMIFTAVRSKEEKNKIYKMFKESFPGIEIVSITPKKASKTNGRKNRVKGGNAKRNTFH